VSGLYSSSFCTNLIRSVIPALSPPLQGGVARLIYAELDDIYFRAGVVIAMDSACLVSGWHFVFNNFSHCRVAYFWRNLMPDC
jgi:hypothetical protein